MTGRSQLLLHSSHEMLHLSEEQYEKVIKDAKLSKDVKENARLQRVGKRVSKAVDDYLKENNIENNFEWEFNLIEDKQVNAWCMPGGKIAFYTGILPITKDDTGMAVVMGHEVAHAVAEHGNERMSHGMLIQGGILATSIGLEVSDAIDGDLSKAILIGAGALASVGIVLPYSRSHELEADYMGLIFMAKAGYNPERAVSFWQDMSKASKGGKPPELLSTHPADTRRIDEIKKYLPKAMYYYRQSPQYQELERKKLIPKF